MHTNEVIVSKINEYDINKILSSLSDNIFDVIKPSDSVVLKPNWVRHSHLGRAGDWDYVITHPAVLTAVLYKVLEKVGRGGEIIICDAPQTDTDFQQLLSYYPVDLWISKAEEKGVPFRIIDLRDDEWREKDGLIISRKKLPGDPKGSVEANLKGANSEFYQHIKSERGYYGADVNIKETNEAHDGYNNKYRVSRTAIEADVFINIPKLKTHKKGGITCCLKNLVGINTYKNFLPHHSEGSPKSKGDQFPCENKNSKIEGPLLAFIKQHLLQNPTIAKAFVPVKKIGRKIFGDTEDVIRSGNWYGNDTLWRMVLDLNKVLYYVNDDGTLKEDMPVNAKRYIGVVDGILGGEGSGPLYPDPIHSGFIVAGTNPVAIDSVCAKIIGFNPKKIPAIANAYHIKNYKLCDFRYEDIRVLYDNGEYLIDDFPQSQTVKYKPHFGWKNYIEEES
jgi:uncharacterized protein (DUF362 family)